MSALEHSLRGEHLLPLRVDACLAHWRPEEREGAPMRHKKIGIVFDEDAGSFTDGARECTYGIVSPWVPRDDRRTVHMQRRSFSHCRR